MKRGQTSEARSDLKCAPNHPSLTKDEVKRAEVLLPRRSPLRGSSGISNHVENKDLDDRVGCHWQTEDFLVDAARYRGPLPPLELQRIESSTSAASAAQLSTFARRSAGQAFPSIDVLQGNERGSHPLRFERHQVRQTTRHTTCIELGARFAHLATRPSTQRSPHCTRNRSSVPHSCRAWFEPFATVFGLDGHAATERIHDKSGFGMGVIQRRPDNSIR